MRKTLLVSAVALVASLLAGSVLAANIVGTAKNDVLKGGPRADKIDGKAGNDKLYGLGGADNLIGGGGNDLLVGGRGADKLNCGGGKDTAQADDSDKVSANCEVVKGLSPPPVVSIADASIAEGNSGSASLSFAVTLSKAGKRAASVRYATADGTASAPGDYASSSGVLTFKPGETSKTINVAVVSDLGGEANESFTVSLSSPVNLTVGDGSATGSITNDDVRSGRYNGTTSQGKPIRFDVSPDGRMVTAASFGFDLNCSEVQGFTVTDTFDMPDMQVGGDGSFGATGSYRDSDVSIVVEFAGKLSMPGNASGTMRIALELYGLPGIGTLHCQTGSQPVTWNAA